MSPPEAYSFLCSCFSHNPKPRALEELKGVIRGDKVNWDAVIPIASNEKVLPALYGRLKELTLASDLPLAIADFLLAVEELNLERNRHILTEVDTITRILNTVSVEPVVLKGIAYILNGAYSSPGARYLLDIDLLIPESQLALIVDLLKNQGYRTAYSTASPMLHHHYPFLLGHANVPIDLHYCLGLGACRSLLSAKEMTNHSRLSNLGGPRLRVPSPEDLITHHIMHSQIQSRYYHTIWPSIRDMWDLTLLARLFAGRLDWTAIQSRFRQKRRHSALALYFALVERSLGTDCTLPDIRLTGVDRMRWFYRCALRASPALRHIDPFYILSSTITHRAHLVPDLRRVAGGWGRLFKVPFRTCFYRSVGKNGLRRAVCDALEWPASAKS